jgi:hypothetical protein
MESKVLLMENNWDLDEAYKAAIKTRKRDLW